MPPLLPPSLELSRFFVYDVKRDTVTITLPKIFTDDEVAWLGTLIADECDRAGFLSQTAEGYKLKLAGRRRW